MRITDIHYNELMKNYCNYIEIARNEIPKDFGGPSSHFHQRSLEELNNSFLNEPHLEMIYATLASWGMHRMGKTYTKLVDYCDFKNTILSHKKELTELKYVHIEDLTVENLKEIIIKLKQICFEMKVSISNSKIVGNSKTLAHILPNLVPPIDRQYTIRFFKCIELRKNVGDFKGENEEKEYFEYIMEKAYDFIVQIKSCDKIIIDNKFNTSYPKIFDNIIVAYIKTNTPSS